MRHAQVLEPDLGLEPALPLHSLLLRQLLHLLVPTLLSLAALFGLPPAVLHLLFCVYKKTTAEITRMSGDPGNRLQTATGALNSYDFM